MFFDLNSSGTVLGGTLIANNSGVGVKCDNASSPSIRHARITANANGVTALNNSAPHLGVATSGYGCAPHGPDLGYNSIYGNTGYNVSNLSTGLTILAEGNWWNANPPKASKFYGLVSREPYLCDDPNPVAPWEGDPRPEDKPGLTLPTHYSLGASQPNPFNPVTTMTFDVPAPGGQVEIAIFDVKGSKVRTLVRGRHAVGTHAATWTGRDDSGEPVASGVYFVRMTAPSFTQTRKVVLLK
jgi:FlgD Ig-like domain